MCAIAGIIDFNNSVSRQELDRMNSAMALRGPNDYGIFINDHVGLAHRRLSIIDVETGHQPMSIDDEQYVIVYNGEVYNFLKIREKLEEQGAVFTTQSDTEVILWAYKVWGIDRSLNLFDGMFTFAIYDKIKQKNIHGQRQIRRKTTILPDRRWQDTICVRIKGFPPQLCKLSD